MSFLLKFTFSGVSSNSNIIVTNVSTGNDLTPYSEILWIKFKKWLRDKRSLARSSIEDNVEFFLKCLLNIEVPVVEVSPACQEDEDCG